MIIKANEDLIIFHSVIQGMEQIVYCLCMFLTNEKLARTRTGTMDKDRPSRIKDRQKGPRTEYPALKRT